MISDVKVRVRFITDVVKYQITDAPFSLPTTLGRSGLSDVINHLLNLDEPVQFDFMISDKLVRTPLQKFLAVNHVSTESIIIINYFPATSMSDSDNSKELPSWIGCLDTSNRNLVVAGCYDGSVRLFNPLDLSEVSTIAAHEDPVRALSCWSSSSSKKSSFLATGGKDHTVKCWDLSNPAAAQHVATLSGHINSVEAISLWRPVANTHDAVLISGDWAGTLFGWNVSNLGGDKAAGNASHDDTQDKKKRKKAADFMGVASGAKPTVNTDMKPLFTIKAHAQAVSGICASRVNNGKNNGLFTTSWDHALKEWDLERQDCINTFASSKVITSLDCSTDASSSMLLATSHPDGKVRCWDSRQREEANVAKVALGKNTQWISQVQWRPDSALVFSASDYEGNVTLWDIRAAVPISSVEAHNGKALCLSWHDNSKIVSGGSDCVLKSTIIQ